MKKNGFTLIELMIVVAIIALLASIAVPAFSRARQRQAELRNPKPVRVYRVEQGDKIYADVVRVTLDGSFIVLTQQNGTTTFLPNNTPIKQTPQ